MYVGYARVSTQDQHLDLQEEALRHAGCQRIMDLREGTCDETSFGGCVDSLLCRL